MCPPGLHTTLGIFYRLWSLLEEECHQLDLELATWTAPQSIDRASFTRYSTSVKKRAQLKERKLELEKYTATLSAGIAQIATQIQNPDSNPLLLALQQEVNSAIKKLQDVVGFSKVGTHVRVLHMHVYRKSRLLR